MRLTGARRVEKSRVHDIEVSGASHYVLENGVVSHNSGLKYTSSVILFINKKKDKDGNDVVGNIIRVDTNKSRFSRENQRVELRLDFKKGLDRYFGLLPMAEKMGIFNKVSTRYELPDGSKVFGKTIEDNPEKYFTQEILDRIEEKCHEFYGLGGTDSEEKSSQEEEEREEEDEENSQD